MGLCELVSFDGSCHRMGEKAKHSGLCSDVSPGSVGRSTSRVGFVLLSASPQNRRRGRLGTWPGATSGGHRQPPESLSPSPCFSGGLQYNDFME